MTFWKAQFNTKYGLNVCILFSSSLLTFEKYHRGRGAVDVGMASGEDPWRRWERAPNSWGGNRGPSYESRNTLGGLFHQHCSGTLKYPPSPSANCIDTMKEVRKKETVYSLNYYFLCLLPANYAPGSVKGTGAWPDASIKGSGLWLLRAFVLLPKGGKLWLVKP